MANIKQEYGTSTALTITLNSLANAGARESTVVDNTSNKFLDVLVAVDVKLASGSPASEKAVYVYAYGSEDGTNYSDNATGSDAAVTMRSPSNLLLIGTINTPDSGALTYKGVFSLSQAFGGNVPRKWGIVVENKTNLAFDSTGCSARYTGVYLSTT